MKPDQITRAQLIKDLAHCPEIVAADATFLYELLHPERDRIDIRYSLARASLPVGQSSLPHRLQTSEVYYILAGRGLMTIAGESNPIQAHQAIYVPPGAIQFLANIGDEPLVFLCIVDPAWQPEDEEVLVCRPDDKELGKKTCVYEDPGKNMSDGI
ncbi:MAG TPA: cupin domain-containing protein [Atribacteraceae bacterium]|nr:cupin domain-containing protein [Atribacteraceae bacterium]